MKRRKSKNKKPRDRLKTRRQVRTEKSQRMKREIIKERKMQKKWQRFLFDRAFIIKLFYTIN